MARTPLIASPRFDPTWWWPMSTRRVSMGRSCADSCASRAVRSCPSYCSPTLRPPPNSSRPRASMPRSPGRSSRRSSWPWSSVCSTARSAGSLSRRSRRRRLKPRPRSPSSIPIPTTSPRARASCRCSPSISSKNRLLRSGSERSCRTRSPRFSSTPRFSGCSRNASSRRRPPSPLSRRWSRRCRMTPWMTT